LGYHCSLSWSGLYLNTGGLSSTLFIFYQSSTKVTTVVDKVHRLRSQDNSANNQRKSKNQLLYSFRFTFQRRIGLYVPESCVDEEATQARNSKANPLFVSSAPDFWSKLAGVAAAIGVFVLIFYTVYTRNQWLVLEKQFETMDRPWIDIDIAIISPLTYANGVNIAFTFVPKNVGRSPAQNILIGAHLTPALMGDDVGKIQRQTCEHPISWPAQFPGYILFPGRQYTQDMGLSLSVTDLNTYWTSKFKQVPKGIDVVPLALVSCIDYTFQASQRHHQTGFAFDVLMKDGTTVLISKTPLAPDSLVLRARLPGTYFAN
jgi:hypothetical protein